jgi:hypothetical protein
LVDQAAERKKNYIKKIKKRKEKEKTKKTEGAGKPWRPTD